MLTLASVLGAAILEWACWPTPGSAAPTPNTLRDLIPASAAKKLGFPSVAKKPTSSNKTGSKLCSSGSEVVYENTKNFSGLIDEVLSCSTNTAAISLLKQFESSYEPSTNVTPPKALGSAAVASEAHPPIYVYYWVSGSYFAFVGIDTDAITNRTEYITHETDPLTPALIHALDKAATLQSSRLRG